MSLPIRPPFPPMEALLVEALPEGEEWLYEPKWDGFRCLAFRDGAEVRLQSKSGQPLERYFPELVEALGSLRPARFVLDGEIAIRDGKALSFDDLLLRLHPAASRVRKLAAETPAMLIVFDLLVDERGELLTQLPLYKRRPRLERFAERHLADRQRFCLSPATEDRRRARRWLATSSSDLDGVIAKRLDLAYRSGDRGGMQKVKRLRTADCVIGGFRYAEGQKEIGSLLLGLYDAEGRLDYVGFASGLSRTERRDLVPQLERLVKPPGFTGRAPGGPSRWNRGKSTEWCPLAPKLVVEVRYDHVTSGRFRHATRLLRWRPDKAPRQCTLEQIVRRRRVTSRRARAVGAVGAAAVGRGAPRSPAARSRARGLRARDEA